MLQLKTNLTPEEVAEKLGISKEDVVISSNTSRKNNAEFYKDLKELLNTLQLTETQEQLFIEELTKYIIYCINELHQRDETYLEYFENLTEDFLEEDRLYIILKKLIHTWGCNIQSKNYRKWRGTYESELDYLS